ncbi:MAG: four helix bundle protein [Rhizobiales bacterium]|nr:four helix bundle protein [Hyphomicrobiales bacterium]
MIQSYRDLKVWQEAMDLAEAAYRISQTMPPSERFGMISQIRRAAVSIPSNIAEGYGRESTGSYVHFLKTARGSLRELETHVLIAHRVGLVQTQETDKLLDLAERIAKMLHALIRSVQSSRMAADK